MGEYTVVVQGCVYRKIIIGARKVSNGGSMGMNSIHVSLGADL